MTNLYTNNQATVFIGLRDVPTFGEWVRISDFLSPEGLESKGKEIIERYKNPAAAKFRPATLTTEEWIFGEWDGFIVPMNERGVGEALLHNELMEELAQHEVGVFKLWVDDDPSRLYGYPSGKLRKASNILDDFHASFCGVYDSLEQYARGYVSELLDFGRSLAPLECYFDHAAFARDLQAEHGVWAAETEDGKVAVFVSI